MAKRAANEVLFLTKCKWACFLNPCENLLQAFSLEGNDNEFEEDDENPDDESDDYNSQHHSVSTSSEEKLQEVRRELKKG